MPYTNARFAISPILPLATHLQALSELVTITGVTGLPRLIFCALFASAFLATCSAQQSQTSATPPVSDKANPQIKVNILNVCTPSETDKQEITAAMSRVPAKVNYSGDFEVTRGQLLSGKEPASKYVRLRREISGDPLFSNVQYSISSDDKNTTETLVFKVKDPAKSPKDLLLISLEDQISASAAKPASVLDTDTPASHIKLERFGKSSIGLARCSEADQSGYKDLFAQATKMLAQYRKALGLRTMFRSDLVWLSASAPSRPSKPHAKVKSPKAAASAETNAAGKHLS